MQKHFNYISFILDYGVPFIIAVCLCILCMNIDKCDAYAGFKAFADGIFSCIVTSSVSFHFVRKSKNNAESDQLKSALLIAGLVIFGTCYLVYRLYTNNVWLIVLFCASLIFVMADIMYQFTYKKIDTSDEICAQ